MTRQGLERRQVWIYLAAILAGLALGGAAPAVSGPFEAMLWPLLGLLLYATFTQVRLTRLTDAFRDRRFMVAALAGNFVLIPLTVWGLLAFMPDDPAIRLGVLLVLLAPCTDWCIAFTHLGGGDASRAIAVTPVNLLAQLALLPVYLWFFMGDAFLRLLAAERVAVVFLALIVLPLAAAWLTERWAEGRPGGAALIERIGWSPIPLLGAVVFLVSASQVQSAAAALPVLGHVLGAFVAFLAAAALIGVALARVADLPTGSARALVFNLGTRNSFVVLPLALALEPHWRTATVVIVFQSLVELFGMVAYLWFAPRLFKPSHAKARRRSPGRLGPPRS